MLTSCSKYLDRNLSLKYFCWMPTVKAFCLLFHFKRGKTEKPPLRVKFFRLKKAPADVFVPEKGERSLWRRVPMPVFFTLLTRTIADQRRGNAPLLDLSARFIYYS